MRCAKQFSIEVTSLPCDPISDLTWVFSTNDPSQPLIITMAGGDGTFSAIDTGNPSGGAIASSISSNIECPAQTYAATLEIDYNLFLQDFGAGSSAGVNIFAYRNGVTMIFFIATAPNNGIYNNAATLSSGPMIMNSGVSYNFQIQVVYGLSGGGVCNLTGVVRLRPLVPP